MSTRLTRTIAISALPLIVALLGCAITDAQVTKSADPPTATPGKAVFAPTIHQVAQTTTLPYDRTGPATATCPAGEVALGGGWSVPQNRINRVFAAKATGNAWSVSVTNPPLKAQTAQNAATQTGMAPESAVFATPEAAGVTITVYAECLAGVSGAVVTQRATTQNFNPTPTDTFNDSLGGTISLCDPGETLVGGGFDFGGSSANLELESSWPRDDVFPVQMWVFSIRNYDTVAHSITHYAECLSGVTVSATYPRQEGSFVFANQTGTAAISCPSGSSLAGGGFQYRMHSPGNERLGNLFSLNANSAGWQGQVLTLSGYGLYALIPLAAAVCLTFSATGATQP
jgi:hypothetical protein